MQRFMRSKCWWNIIGKSPLSLLRYMTQKHPVVGFGSVIGLYLIYWKFPLDRAEKERFQRFRRDFLADVHYQENVDWGTRKERDSMKDFIKEKVAQHGSIDAAAKAYAEQSGQPAPPFLLNDPVLDKAFERIGIENEKEVNFLWDGTRYMGDEKPPTFANGKIAIPEPPTFYNPA